MTTNQYTDFQLIEKYLALKKRAEEMKKAYDAEVEPYTEGMTIIENVIHGRLNERGAQNTKTDAGIAYKSEIMTVKIVDRDAFLAFCTDKWEEIGDDLLQVKATKEAVKSWMDQGKIGNNPGPPPPGIEVSYYININIR